MTRATTCANLNNGICPFVGGFCRDGKPSATDPSRIWVCPVYKSKARRLGALTRWRRKRAKEGKRK